MRLFDEARENIPHLQASKKLFFLALLRTFSCFRVSLTRTNLEENTTNLHGIKCVHVEGQDDIVSPLETSSNVTDIREKMNEIIKEMGKNTQFRANTDSRIKQMEMRIDNQLNSVAASAALQSDKETVKVQNSTLLESALIIVCICFTIFMGLKTLDFVRRNFFGRSRPMRAVSENTLSMNVDY